MTKDQMEELTKITEVTFKVDLRDPHDRPELLAERLGCTVEAARQLLEDVKRGNGCQCDACRQGVIHVSCCAVHNMPAYPNAACDCGAEPRADG